MTDFMRIEKRETALPVTLTPNTLYLLKKDNAVEIFVSNADGSAALKATGDSGQISNSISQLNSSATITDVADGKFELVLDGQLKLKVEGPNFDFKGTPGSTSSWFVNLGDASGGTQEEIGSSIVVDHEGNTIVVGGDGNIGNAIVVKISPSGVVLWQKHLSLNANTDWVFGDGIDVDAAGNIYFSVYSSFGCFLVKLLSDGTLVWQTSLGSSNFTYWALTTDDNGNTVVAGRYNSTPTDAFISKIDTNGNKLWTHVESLAVTDQIWLSDVIVDAGGFIFAVGYGTTSGENRGFIIKLDSSGTLIWNKNVTVTEGANTNGSFRGIVATSEHLYICGSCDILTGRSQLLCKVNKTDASVVWSQYFNIPGNGTLFSIAIDPVTETVYSLVYELSTTGYADDLVIVATNSNGDVLRATQIGTALNEGIWWNNGHHALAYRDSKIFCTGYTYVSNSLENMFVCSLPGSGDDSVYNEFHAIPYIVTSTPITYSVADTLGTSGAANAEVFVTSTLVDTTSSYPWIASYKITPQNVTFDKLESDVIDTIDLNTTKINSPFLTCDPILKKVSLGYNGGTGITDVLGSLTINGQPLGGGTPFATDIVVNGLTVGKGPGIGIGNTVLGINSLSSNANGNYNIGIGDNALTNNISGEANIGIGFSALENNTLGLSNVAIGQSALAANTTGSYNTTVGHGSLGFNTTGFGNVAVGRESLPLNTTGYQNTGLGKDSLYYNQTGNNNTGIGFGALYTGTTASNNVAVGAEALFYNNVGQNNVAIGSGTLRSSLASLNTGVGHQALHNAQLGIENTALGAYSLFYSTSGNYNTALGRSAGFGITTGGQNVLVGRNAGTAITTGSRNTIIGENTGSTTLSDTVLIAAGTTERIKVDASGLYVNGVFLEAGGGGGSPFADDIIVNEITVGKGGSDVISNTALGKNALRDNGSVGIRNVAIGEDAMVYNTIGKHSVAVGYRSLQSSTASWNVSIGAYSMNNNSTGASNVAVGESALYSNILGNQNTAVGNGALYYNNAPYNSGFGSSALSSNVSGQKNTAIGAFAMYENTVGIYNTASGYYALGDNTTGSQNTANGYQALLTNGVGSNNTANGYQALTGNTTGNNNTALGFQAGLNITTGINNTCLGSNSTSPLGETNNTITLGNSEVTSLRCQVTAITALSDRRDKTDIAPLTFGLDFINTLNPVSFTWNTRDGAKVGIKSSGFIAQDLKVAQEAAGAKDTLNLVLEANPEKLEATYGHLIPVLVKAIQELKKEFDDYKALHSV